MMWMRVLPKLANIVAYSQPTTPAPMMTMLSGKAGNASIWSLVTTSSPSTGMPSGTRGCEPAASRKFVASIVSIAPSRRFTSRACGDTNRPLPRTSVTMPPFAEGAASDASWRSSSERRSATAVRTDSITFGYDTSIPPGAW